MRKARIWKRLLGVERTVIEEVVFDESADAIVARVRPAARERRRCGVCHRRSHWYDLGRGRRRWRALDHGTTKVFLEAEAPRVACPVHGPTVIAVPWARHDAGHTKVFDQQVAWLATQCSKTAVAALMRTSWRTVGTIVERFQADHDAGYDRLAGLTRIGIDEVSYRKGHKYMTVVVDHDTRHVVWMADGHGKDVLRSFFDALGTERAARLTHISADGASWIAEVLTERAGQAIRVMDPFHVVAWATEALDAERRRAWNQARRTAMDPALTKRLKNSRYALWKNPQDLTDPQAAKLEWIAKTDPRLYRGYLLKEGLRTVFTLARTRPQAALTALDRWISWARRCRIEVFVELQRRILKHRDAIHAALTTGMSNGLIESANTKTRLIIRRGFGFKYASAVIALVMLTLGGHSPELPDRQPA